MLKTARLDQIAITSTNLTAHSS